MRAIDVTTAVRDVLPPVCAGCTWWQPAHGSDRSGRVAWERTVEMEAGMFGKAALDGDDVLGWLQAAPAGRVPRAWLLPGGPPGLDAWLITCAYFYDDEFLRGFQWLLQDLEAALKLREVAAVEAFALLHPGDDDRFRGYLRPCNLFHAGVLEGAGFRMVRRCGEVGLYRLDLATLIAAPRWSRARERLEKGAVAQPI